MPYESWVERQVREAMERGEFDNLPGQGKPLAGLTGRDDEDWWVRKFVERERISLLPTTLALRKELTELPQNLAGERDEAEVRRRIEDLNDRVRYTHRHRVDGPPLVLARSTSTPPSPTGGGTGPAEGQSRRTLSIGRPLASSSTSLSR